MLWLWERYGAPSLPAALLENGNMGPSRPNPILSHAEAPKNINHCGGPGQHRDRLRLYKEVLTCKDL